MIGAPALPVRIIPIPSHTHYILSGPRAGPDILFARKGRARTHAAFMTNRPGANSSIIYHYILEYHMSIPRRILLAATFAVVIMLAGRTAAQAQCPPGWTHKLTTISMVFPG